MTQIETKNIFVALTNGNMEATSRHDMLDWVNSQVNGHYKKIEELCSGVAYCQLMEKIFPHNISLKKVKMAAKLEHEFMHNLRLLQTAFTRLNIDKAVPSDRIVRGRFQDNFEFLQWFKKFYEVHAADKENCQRTSNNALIVKVMHKTQKTPSPKNEYLHQKIKCTDAENQGLASGGVQVLQEQLAQVAQETNILEYERNYYFKKISDIKALIRMSLQRHAHVEWCQRALQICSAGELHADDNIDCESDDTFKTAEL